MIYINHFYIAIHFGNAIDIYGSQSDQRFIFVDVRTGKLN